MNDRESEKRKKKKQIYKKNKTEYDSNLALIIYIMEYIPKIKIFLSKIARLIESQSWTV